MNHIKCKDKFFANLYLDSTSYFEKNEIVEFAKNKEDLEAILSAKKYNQA